MQVSNSKKEKKKKSKPTHLPMLSRSILFFLSQPQHNTTKKQHFIDVHGIYDQKGPPACLRGPPTIIGN